MPFKNGMTAKQAAEVILRKYLIRCHATVSKQYPEIAQMSPVNAADYLLHLRKTGRITMKLWTDSINQVRCSIESVPPDDGSGV